MIYFHFVRCISNVLENKENKKYTFKAIPKVSHKKLFDLQMLYLR